MMVSGGAVVMMVSGGAVVHDDGVWWNCSDDGVCIVKL